MQSNPIAIIRSQKLIQSIIFTMVCDFHKVTRKWPTKLEKRHFVLLIKHKLFVVLHASPPVPHTSSCLYERRSSIHLRHQMLQKDKYPQLSCDKKKQWKLAENTVRFKDALKFGWRDTEAIILLVNKYLDFWLFDW